MINVQKLPFFRNKKIINRSVLSKSFGIICEKVALEDNKEYVLKYYFNRKEEFNSIFSEGKSLEYMQKKFPIFFPKLRFLNSEIIIIDFINHDGKKNKNYQKKLALLLADIHKIKNKKYGFYFDTQIGGLKQPCDFEDNWINFFREKRLGMIFELINKYNPMPIDINRNIEILLNKLDYFLPRHPIPSLIHGDLWEGNILFNKGELVGLIDPGVQFAHNEMELAYLTWFKYIDNEFFNHYNKYIQVDNNYFEYEPIYQLYFCLLNVHLWSRKYIKNTRNLLKKIIKK